MNQEWHKYQWNYNKTEPECQEAEVLNEYMKFIVKIIRETGETTKKDLF